MTLRVGDMTNVVQQRLKPRVLVVDDDPQARAYTRAVLERAGVEVVEAATGNEALAKLMGEHFDLVCLDLSLPETSGFDILAELARAPRGNLPMLVLSARGLPIDRAHAEELGAAGYLTKPFAPDALIQRVEALVARAGKQAG
ncbi:MAG: response regulator transcription factor [Deltaproteobacteria bacterium]|nr:response regulator transcription factor [Deltaproteobacteria bacterium]